MMATYHGNLGILGIQFRCKPCLVRLVGLFESDVDLIQFCQLNLFLSWMHEYP